MLGLLCIFGASSCRYFAAIAVSACEVWQASGLSIVCWQLWEHCTGIDTGCVLGDTLTALVLPSITELEARGWKPSEATAVTRAAVSAELVSVPARQQYST